MTSIPERAVVVQVPVIGERGVVANWSDDSRTYLSVRSEGDETYVHIEGNAAALESLARQLLCLAQDEAQPGYNLVWASDSGWFENSEVGLRLERKV